MALESKHSELSRVETEPCLDRLMSNSQCLASRPEGASGLSVIQGPGTCTPKGHQEHVEQAGSGPLNVGSHTKRQSRTLFPSKMEKHTLTAIHGLFVNLARRDGHQGHCELALVILAESGCIQS
jgi:hypothetical protein